MRNILLVVCIPLGLMLTAPSDAQQPVSQKPAQNTSASQNQTELGKLIGTVEQLDKRLERVENRLERVENRQNELDEKMDDKFDELNKRIDELDKQNNYKFERINNRMNAEFKQLNNRMDTMFYWIMGVIVAFGVPMIIPIFIPFALDSYRRWKDSRPSPPSPVSSPQAVSGQESTKQATGGQESAVNPPRPLSES